MTENKMKIFDEIPSPLNSTKLPKKSDVIKAIYFEKNRASINEKNAIDIVIEQLKQCWNLVDVPIVSDQRIKVQMNKILDEYKSVAKTDFLSEKHDKKRFSSYKVL